MANQWISLESLVNHYDLDGVKNGSFDDQDNMAAQPYYELSDALLILKDKEKWQQIVENSVDHKFQLMAGEIEQSLQVKLQVL